MKLIDADALRETVIKFGNVMGEDMTDAIFYINIAPTVDAIPVEWIEKWLDEFLGVKLEEEITNLDPFKKNVYQGILLMYNEWRRTDDHR